MLKRSDNSGLCIAFHKVFCRPVAEYFMILKIKDKKSCLAVSPNSKPIVLHISETFHHLLYLIRHPMAGDEHACHISVHMVFFRTFLPAPHQRWLYVCHDLPAESLDILNRQFLKHAEKHMLETIRPPKFSLLNEDILGAGYIEVSACAS